jgi:hypothetical protein
LSNKDPEKDKDPDTIRKSLNDVVQKLGRDSEPDEFDSAFRKIQDELTELEFKVYNMRLGTKIRA